MTRHSLDSGAGQAMGEIDRAEIYNTVLEELRTSGALGLSSLVYDPYSSTERDVRVLALLRDGQTISAVVTGDRVEVVLDSTPFYVESGGQVSDTGIIEGKGWIIDIEDVRRPVGGLIVHVGEVVEGKPTAGTNAIAIVDAKRRLDIMRNHTATHLLHAQLRTILGLHVQQKGSLVAPDRLRFDFSHNSPLSTEELTALTSNINNAILANLPVIIEEKDLQTARSEGVIALFGEKYGERVRTVAVDDGGKRYSYELCGGTHAPMTAVIGTFIIISESSVAQDTRRIEALTGYSAQEYIGRQIDHLRGISNQLGVIPEQLVARVGALRDELAQARRQGILLHRQIARLEFEQLLNQVETINNISVLIAQVQPTTMDILREMTDWFRNKVRQGVVVLSTVNDRGPQIVAAVTDDLTKRIHAEKLIRAIAPSIGGGGGGRSNWAQAGGKEAAGLGKALAHSRAWITEALNE